MNTIYGILHNNRMSIFKKEQCSVQYVTENKYMTQLGCQCQTAGSLLLDD